MKFILSTLLLLTCFVSTAQTISIAVYKDCFNTESPYECSSEKLRNDITNLISEDITNEIKNSSTNNYFLISLAFLSDENGKTIPETIEISCEHELLSDTIKKYLSELPLFEPKNNDDKEKRSVHIGYYVFLYDNDNHKYYPITKDEAAEANIKPVFVHFGTPPSLKGCESNDKEAEQKCSKEKINQKVAKKINPNKIKGEPRTIKLFANFTVEKNGEVTIKEITCSEDNEELIEQYRKALGKIPDFNPGTFKGIPVRSNYTLPVTINLQ